ncbi:MAG: substrate-binding domain-containing protein [Planctomycetes bacterium]|nr:substrate-binding domain-containing protein [Planctomycetota bacterium]
MCSKSVSIGFFIRGVRMGSMLSAAFAVVVLFLAATGCDSRSGGSGSNAVGTEQNPAKAFDITKPTVEIRIGAILMQQDQFFRSNEQGMKDSVNQFGGNVTTQNAGGELDKEIAIVDAFITQKVRAIVVSPLNSKGSVNALKKAHDAGIRIITYNNSLDADFPACTISSDQYELGASSGRAARDYVHEKLGGKARVALIGFASQLPEQGAARLKGFKDEITQLPGVEIIAEQDAWIAPKATEVVSELLAKKPNIIWGERRGDGGRGDGGAECEEEKDRGVRHGCQQADHQNASVKGRHPQGRHGPTAARDGSAGDGSGHSCVKGQVDRLEEGGPGGTVYAGGEGEVGGLFENV